MRSRLFLAALCGVMAACEDGPSSSSPAPNAAAGARPGGGAAAASALGRPQGNSAAAGGSAPDVVAAPAARPARERLKAQRSGSQLVVQTQAKWARPCKIHNKCAVTAPALVRCEASKPAEPWSTLADQAEQHVDSRLSVSGRLVLDDSVFSTAVACAAGQCCNHVSVRAVLAGPVVDVELVGLGCAGDESRLCCNVSAEGQQVVATGRLRRAEASKAWQLVDASLCALPD